MDYLSLVSGESHSAVVHVLTQNLNAFVGITKTHQVEIVRGRFLLERYALLRSLKIMARV